MSYDSNKAFTSLEVKGKSCDIEKLPTLPDRITVRVDHEVVDMADPGEYKHAILVVFLIAIVCLAGGAPLLSSNENNTEPWDAIVFAVAMMFIGVIMVIVGYVLYWQKKVK